jgi:flagellar motor switch protein FliG
MATAKRFDDMKGIDKAAGLLLALPADDSAKVLRCLEESYLERLTTRLLKADDLPTEVLDSVLREADAQVNAQEYIARGGDQGGGVEWVAILELHIRAER